MNANDPMVACTGCGKQLPRSEMFGVEPDLNCPDCAAGVRQRMHVRYRPLARERKPYVTIACLVIAGALYVATDLVYGRRSQTPTPAWLLALYQREPIWLGEVWRHLSCVFLHGGLWHVALNGFALWFLGRVIEFGWGHWAMAGLMVGTGVSASVLQWVMQGSGVGLSGAIFGLCGFLWALRRVHGVAAAVMNERMIRWILTMLVLGVVLSATGQLAIGNWAHGGGLVSGYLIGMAVRARPRAPWLGACALGVVLLVVLSVFFVFGTVDMKGGAEWPRSQWRTYWLEHYADP